MVVCCRSSRRSFVASVGVPVVCVAHPHPRARQRKQSQLGVCGRSSGAGDGDTVAPLSGRCRHRCDCDGRQWPLAVAIAAAASVRRSWRGVCDSRSRAGADFRPSSNSFREAFAINQTTREASSFPPASANFIIRSARKSSSVGSSARHRPSSRLPSRLPQYGSGRGGRSAVLRRTRASASSSSSAAACACARASDHRRQNGVESCPLERCGG